MYGAYKGTRRPTPDDLRDQFPIVRETLAAFRIPIFDLDGYEADDLIGTLSLQAQEQGIETRHRVGRPGHAPAGVRAHDS